MWGFFVLFPLGFEQSAGLGSICKRLRAEFGILQG